MLRNVLGTCALALLASCAARHYTVPAMRYDLSGDGIEEVLHLGNKHTVDVQELQGRSISIHDNADGRTYQLQDLPQSLGTLYRAQEKYCSPECRKRNVIMSLPNGSIKGARIKGTKVEVMIIRFTENGYGAAMEFIERSALDSEYIRQD